uniref:Uncharacterized protein n=1 Tax=Mycena chlorophos TaxID=658473 RepID=A0ABQ0LE53_MYCCL|nr:predicted protein [Mycena chlorophos]
MAPSSLPKLKVNVDIEKTLPDAPALLTPQRKDRRASPLPFATKRTKKEPRLTFNKRGRAAPLGRMRWTFALPALFVAILVLGVATVLLLFVVVLGRVPSASINDPSSIYVSHPPTRLLLGLTISTISTHIVAISVPVLVSVVAYCVAGKWLEEQELPNPPRVVLPSPLQYGLMVKMLTTSSIGSVIQAGQYLHSSNGRARTPRAFHMALSLTSLILGLSFSLILADVWLHAAVSIVPGGALFADGFSSLNVVFNESVCADVQGSSCLNDTAGWAATQPWIVEKGLLVAANETSDFLVTTLSSNSTGDLALVIPRSASQFGFQLSTFGVAAQCVNLTPNCTSAADPPSLCDAATRVVQPSASAKPSASPSASASASASPSTSSAAPSSSSSTTSVRATSGPNANPQAVVMQLEWPETDISLANDVATKSSNGDIRSWASCELSFYNVTFQQQPGSRGDPPELTLASPAFANIMQGALLSQVGNLQLLSNLEATMFYAADEASALAAMNREVARVTLALFSGTLELQATTPSPHSHSDFFNAPPSLQPAGSLGRYPIAPLTIYLVLVYSYALTAFGIYLYAACLRAPIIRGPNRFPATVNAAQLAQLRLTDPLAQIAALYPSPGQPAAPEDLQELFLEEEDVPRLDLGIRFVQRESEEFLPQQPVFGAHRRLRPWARSTFDI